MLSLLYKRVRLWKIIRDPAGVFLFVVGLGDRTDYFNQRILKYACTSSSRAIMCIKFVRSAFVKPVGCPPSMRISDFEQHIGVARDIETAPTSQVAVAESASDFGQRRSLGSLWV